MHTKQKPIIRLISCILIGTFFASEISYASPVDVAGAVTAPQNSLQTLLQDPTRFEAPLDFVCLREIHKGENGKLIIHIQDAHSNLSGQQNLANALDQIMTKYQVSLILSEGGSNDCSLTSLKKIAPSEVWKRLAKSYLIQGKISGEEYLNLVSDHPMKIMGLEDINLYLKSVQNYAELADKREETLGYLKNIQRALDKLKKKLYPEELLEYEGFGSIRRSESRRDEESHHDEILRRSAPQDDMRRLLELATAKGIDLSEFPYVSKLVELQLKEKLIDFNLANLEQAALIEEISNHGGGEELKDYLGRTNKAQDSKAAQFAYFQNTLNIAQSKNILMSKYPNFVKYGEYLKDFSEIDLDQLLEEFTKAEDRVYVALLPKLPLTPSLNKEGGSSQSSQALLPSFFKEGTKGSSDNKDALLIRSIDRYIRLLQTAYQIQMTTKDFNSFQANEPDFATPAYLGFINRKLAELGYFEDLLPYEDRLERGKKALETFYDSVSQRDSEFLKNTEKILKEENQKVAVLISGGYHTPHLKKLFVEKGYSMAVLTPIVTSETNQSKYEKLLLEPIKKEVKTITVSTMTPHDNVRPLDLVAAARLPEQNMKSTNLYQLAFDGARLAGQSEADASRLATQTVQNVIASPIQDGRLPAGRQVAISPTVKGARLAYDEVSKKVEKTLS